MNKPNFFCKLETLNSIAAMQDNDESRDIEMTMDIIEIPLCFAFTADENKWTVKAILRGDIFSHEYMFLEEGSIVIDKKTGKVTINAKEGLEEVLKAVFSACKKLSAYIIKNDLESIYTHFDPDEEGIMLYDEDGELKFTVVSGKDRPEMMCVTLLGEIVMCRPYMNDIWENSESEYMSVEEMINAAENGDEDCMADLADMYLNGDDETDADPEKAVYWYTKLAEADDTTGMFNLGLLLAKGHGTNRDFEKAAYWMEKAAEEGDADAANVAKVFQELFENHIKAEAGNAEAQAKLAGGYLQLAGYLNQAGSDKDYRESFNWAEKAAAKGNSEGMWILALAYEHGRGVAQNINTAIDYYKKGAELGSAECMHNLGYQYSTGEYIKKDLKKAFELFERSAEKGYGLAMKALGSCYQFGYGCMGNMKKALEWYRKALNVMYDPELESKVMIFSSMEENNPFFGEDYSGMPEDF